MPTTTAQPSTQTATASSAGALQGEAASAATGDIPDNQVFVRFADPSAGFSMRYPEGWAQSGSGSQIAFRDKNNIVRVVVAQAPAETVASVRREMASLRSATPTLRFRPPVSTRVGAAAAIKVVYTTESAPNPVTNKRVQLVVDRYYLEHGGRRAIVDLGTPVGVDNVDAYRLMIQSFRWR